MKVFGLDLRTLAFACSVFVNVVFGSYVTEQDGSILVSRRCDCDSVEFWLPVRANGDSNVLSYEEIGRETRKGKQLFSKTDFDRGFRLWLPKRCYIQLDTEILRKDAKMEIQNIASDVVEVWVKSDLSKGCFAASLKCELESTCIGIRSSSKDQNIIQSSQRKLLMYETNNDNKSDYQHYGVLLSIFSFCSMVILVALCGKTAKNSHDSVAFDHKAGKVTILSSEKVKSVPRKREDEVVEVIVENSNSLQTDRNSNNSKQAAADVGLSSVIVTGCEPGKGDAKICVDGVVLSKKKRGCSVESTKEKGEEVNEGRSNNATDEQKENISGRKNGEESEIHGSGKDKQREEKKTKHKEKEVKDKERHKDLRSKRSNTSPTERVDHKSSTKMRFSLKGSSSTSNTYEEPKMTKKDKKRSKKNHDGCSPVIPDRPPFPGDRRSFANRELPKRPSEDRDDPPDDDDDDDDDVNYEHVITTKGPPRSPANLTVPSSNFDNDSGVYDSVDDTKKSKVLASAGPVADEDEDQYEIVVVKSKATKETSHLSKLYESVGGVYDEPSQTKPRSFSDSLPGPSTSKTDAERKTMSLGRDICVDRECAPTPPPIERIEVAKESYHHVIDDIEPYTVTVKKGDRIIQEMNFEAILRDNYKQQSANVEVQELSEDEKAKLYTKVDKVKQKKDRMEAEMSERDVPDGNQVNDTTMASASVVASDEHPYEVVSPKDSVKVLQKKGSFEETEDYDAQHYEEVQTKEVDRPITFV